MKEYIIPDKNENGYIYSSNKEELIRCKDCKIKPRCVMYRDNKDPYGFCKWSERKE